MRKIGKYEKQPDTKSVLLHTYLTSLLSMVLCVCMFCGTSYAWFTSEVSNTGNEIYIGTLDVDLQNKDGKSLAGSDEKLFDSGVRWEPGYTALETIKVVNKGDLAFRYVLSFTEGNITSSDDTNILKSVAENFVVYVHAGGYAEDETAPKSFVDIENSEKWTPVRMGNQIATLADILGRDLPVLSGNMEDVRTYDALATTPAGPGPSDSKPTEETYIIALHMKEEAEAEDVKGHRISLNVKLTAYQRTHEADAFGSTYDLQAQVNDLGEQTIKYRWGTSGGAVVEPMTLDTSYQFLPVETYEEALEAPYKKYIADFVVWADQDVAGDSMALAGYYDAWCKLIDHDWIALTSPDPIPAGKQIRLVDTMGSGFAVTYEMLCEYGNDGIGFLCGAADLTGANAGTTITVELRLYEVVNDGNGSNVETGRYITVGSYDYKFE